MKGYQLRIKGLNNLTYEIMKIYSKNIYLHYPTEKEQKDFLNRCLEENTTNSFSIDIAINEPYELQILDVEVIR